MAQTARQGGGRAEEPAREAGQAQGTPAQSGRQADGRTAATLEGNINGTDCWLGLAFPVEALVKTKLIQ